MKISVKQIVRESASFYKASMKKCAVVSFMFFLFIVFLAVLTYALPLFEKDYRVYTLLAFSFFLLLIAAVVLLPKLVLAMLILLNAALAKAKKQMKLGEAYRETKGKYWPMIGSGIVISLPLYILDMILNSFLGISNTAWLFTVYFVFVSPCFFMLLPMMAIEPKQKQYLKKAIQMIKGNYIAAFLLAAIPIAFWAVFNSIFTIIILGNPMVTLIISAVGSFFTVPFVSTVSVVMYRKLKNGI